MRYRALALSAAALLLATPAAAETWTETVEVEVVLDDTVDRETGRELAAERARITALRRAPQYVQQHEVLTDDGLEDSIDLLSAAMMEIEPVDEAWGETETGQQRLDYTARVTVDTDVLDRRADMLRSNRDLREELEQLASRHYFHTRRGPLGDTDRELTRDTVNTLARLSSLREDGRRTVASFSEEGLDAMAAENERAIPHFYQEFLPRVRERIKATGDGEVEVLDSSFLFTLARVEWEFHLPDIPERYSHHLESLRGLPKERKMGLFELSREERLADTRVAYWAKSDAGRVMLLDLRRLVFSQGLVYPGFDDEDEIIEAFEEPHKSLHDLEHYDRLGPRKKLVMAYADKDDYGGAPASLKYDSGYETCVPDGEHRGEPYGVRWCGQARGETKIVFDRRADESGARVTFRSSDYELPETVEDSRHYDEELDLAEEDTRPAPRDDYEMDDDLKEYIEERGGVRAAYAEFAERERRARLGSNYADSEEEESDNEMPDWLAAIIVVAPLAALLL